MFNKCFQSSRLHRLNDIEYIIWLLGLHRIQSSIRITCLRGWVLCLQPDYTISIFLLRYSFCNFNGMKGMAELHCHRRIQSYIDKKNLIKTFCLLHCMLNTLKMTHKSNNCAGTQCTVLYSVPWKILLRKYIYFQSIFSGHYKECNDLSSCKSCIQLGITHMLCHLHKKMSRNHIWKMWDSTFFSQDNLCRYSNPNRWDNRMGT